MDYTGGTANTTTYANDIQGLTQVLLADDGTTQTANLFGFDLIHQQSNQQSDPLFLLTDGLGSVRQEVAADAVAATTTYAPYGNVLNQSGESNTAYGYTGEQHDSATGLLYLRARYYNPAQRSFMGHDPWSGNMQNPQSMNGWSYVGGNPSNLTDLTGMFPDSCGKNSKDLTFYIECVTDHYGVGFPLADWERIVVKMDHMLKYGVDYELYRDLGLYDYIDDLSVFDEIVLEADCFGGPVPYRGIGFYEGQGEAKSILVSGEQMVYDFARLERYPFTYDTTTLSDSGANWNTVVGAGLIYELRSWKPIRDEYTGSSIGFSVGLAPSAGYEVGVDWEYSFGISDPTVTTSGTGWYWGYNFEAGLTNYAGSLNYYEPNTERGTEKSYINSDRTVRQGELMKHLLFGNSSPVNGVLPNSLILAKRGRAIGIALKYAWVYEDMWKATN